jgi:hypothetical protein
MNDPDRKTLWGRAGSRCAFCNIELTQIGNVDSIVGDEAHIRSAKDGGPRHDSAYPSENLDSYANRILLCKIHHKLVDDNPEQFTTELLEGAKSQHERRVKTALDPKRDGWVEPALLLPVATGTQLMNIIAEAYVQLLNNDHPESDEERDTIVAFFQNLQDWSDIADEIGAGGRVNAAADLHEQLIVLKELGFHVLGGLGRYRVRGVTMPASAVLVTKQDIIVALSSDEGP